MLNVAKLLPLAVDFDRGGAMKKLTAAWTTVLIFLTFGAATTLAQQTGQPPKGGKPALKSPDAITQKMNIEEYVQLLRSDVRQQKAEIMGAMMQLSAGDAAKFWPIYSDYDAALEKVNDMRVANIQQYARDYRQLTDDEADELIRKAADYQKQRSELLAQYYGRVKDSLGAVTAARFIQVEHQLLLLIDLQIDASLPLAGQKS
jgi:hypothetical protein